jgi:hypothetical protein
LLAIFDAEAARLTIAELSHMLLRRSLVTTRMVMGRLLPYYFMYLLAIRYIKEQSEFTGDIRERIDIYQSKSPQNPLRGVYLPTPCTHGGRNNSVSLIQRAQFPIWTILSRSSFGQMVGYWIEVDRKSH